MTFDDVMKLTATVSSHTAYEVLECEALFNVVNSLPPRSSILEVGVEYGRSGSILGQVAKEQHHHLTFIDPFVDPLSRRAFLALMERIGCTYTLWSMRTEDVFDAWLPYEISLLHIDGDHSAAGLGLDIERLAPRVVPGGYICFHDYARESLPDVFTVVNELIDSRPMGWIRKDHVGTFACWRRW